MSDQGAVPIIVVTKRQEHVEAINSTLRNAGHPVHCTWLTDARNLGSTLTKINPELLLCFSKEIGAGLEGIIKIRERYAPEVPVVAMETDADEDAIARAMAAGAQDLVSLTNRSRLASVATREIRSYRLEKALNSTLDSANQYKRQLQALMQGSAAAISYVQDGIVIEANPAWLELFGFAEAEEISGLTLMDMFEQESHAALKGALVACAQGKWNGHPLMCAGHCSDGTTLPMDLELTKADFEGESCVRICISTEAPVQKQPEQRINDVMHRDGATGFFHRRYFLEKLDERLRDPARGGVRALAYIKPDKFSTVKDKVGPVASEEILTLFATLIGGLMQPADLYGRFGGTMFTVLLERGTMRDVEAWGDHIVTKVSENLFEVDDSSFSLTCTVGIAKIDGQTLDIATLISEAEKANKQGRERGGNQVATNVVEDTETRVQAYDAIWIKHIKAALMDNRFRLLHQPIASLMGSRRTMYDILVRMLDHQGNDVLAGDFIPAAARNGLMKNLDRWIIAASINLCSEKKPDGVFIRLSKDSILDDSLCKWLKTQIKTAGVEPARLVFQITQEDAKQHLRQAKALVERLQEMKFRFAVEHFGVDRDPLQILSYVPTDFIKIDGSLMQGLATNQILQHKIKGFVEEAKRKNIETIAERVEDANTMAVLWQLGVHFMQGYYLHEPEVVLEEAKI